jgi:hypothetical protein
VRESRSVVINGSFLTRSFGLLVAPRNHLSICCRVTVWIVNRLPYRHLDLRRRRNPLLKPLLLPEDLEAEDRRFKQGVCDNFYRVIDPRESRRVTRQVRGGTGRG